MKFEWNSLKAEKNLRKHGVSFHEAATVLADDLSITYCDPDHSAEERRFITVGMSRFGHIVMVSHTDQGQPHRNRHYEEGQ